MTEFHRLFQKGDEVIITLKGRVDAVSDDANDEQPYSVEITTFSEESLGDFWFAEEDIVGTPGYVAEVPIMPGERVYLKGYKGRIGEVIALRKGHATVDWEPDDPEAFATSTHPISLLLRPEPKS